MKSKKYEYVVKEDILKIQIYINDDLVNEIDKATFNRQADYLYAQIVKGKNKAFSIEATERFMGEIGCNRLAPPSSDKTDIIMQIQAIKTGFAPICWHCLY